MSHFPVRLLIGDFNTTKHFVDEAGAGVPGSQFIDALESAGWTEIWRKHNPDAKHEFTWYTNQSPFNGFRIDHAYCTDLLLPFIKSASYSHSERELKISDHSILNVWLEM